MSNYEFLQHLNPSILTVYEPYYADDGSFGVMIEDSEGWHTDVIWFDKNGNYLDKNGEE